MVKVHVDCLPAPENPHGHVRSHEQVVEPWVGVNRKTFPAGDIYPMYPHASSLIPDRSLETFRAKSLIIVNKPSL